MPKLPTLQSDPEPPTGNDAGDRTPLVDAVRGGVLTALGRPPGLFQVTVRPLWEDYYRVNVVVGPAAPRRIAVAISSTPVPAGHPVALHRLLASTRDRLRGPSGHHQPRPSKGV